MHIQWVCIFVVQYCQVDLAIRNTDVSFLMKNTTPIYNMRVYAHDNLRISWKYINFVQVFSLNKSLLIGEILINDTLNLVNDKSR